ncbi:acyl-coenzyme A synthetase/AMP-(fatty) acid ligase/alpha-beta hydrolase superfamily lysophospholipase [Microbacterium halimionae]|uniref:Acyl-coenzyme A synthetase/AMP-(Fatty) acid ligase/alpha-beta hydrolase superfamily lysophospholipase n=1 Tax=Microbacterium halimionae TaxID=1526413 RepID=A0A7W3PN76_9MICO|nr:alpha/beta fold hydrolase [Microbacterium halimionae]MBA8817679.1 acyl-coenzyme A synthetase/AMP-(fatty) acid ligase/alpha-beta hydrolase superfamily lysophospholipase [Microbacterium halimionae]NII94552.1 acyl-coenzyme A synthetase/AMP-(fatty) acid ligase/alpha-beta hydrolase superfamily lysophospholipase [Microbacterium halimionae]
MPQTHAPTDLPGLDATYSRTATVVGRGLDAGVERHWHYLDNGDALTAAGIEPEGTILAVHGNPTWSYMWRSLVAASVTAAQAGGRAWRVVAVDQLEMGFSERTSLRRTLRQRVDDLAAFTAAVPLTGPVITLGHDWGGVVSLGWATEHTADLAATMLLNTAVHHDDGTPIPAPLRLAGARGMLGAGSVNTTAFLDVTLALASPPLERDVRDAYRAPYLSAERRRGIGAFVADIPVGPSHESFSELTRIADGIRDLGLPTLMLWGPKDPIFSDRYLNDLMTRMPQADVHRFEGAGHLIAEDAPFAATVLSWLDALGNSPLEVAPAAAFEPLWSRLDARADDDSVAVVEMGADGTNRRVNWQQLDDRVRRLAEGLHRHGVRRGDRVSLLVPPGATLTAVVYACLRIGAVVVVADAGLGAKGLGRAIRGAWPRFVIGDLRGLTAARVLRWPGERISTRSLPRASAAALGVSTSLGDLIRGTSGTALPPEPEASEAAAILFTSGSTGPAKGALYTHAQLSGIRDALVKQFDLTSESGLVTGFAPFALLGPALGARSATPDMDVSAPRTLTARAVAAAVTESDADIVFLSPAAVLNVVATADELSPAARADLESVRIFLSTGAPISEALLQDAARLMPNAEPHVVYGMTECLLVSDITLDGVHGAAVAPDSGVCVGRPVAGVSVRVSALDAHGHATGEPSDTPGVLGEVVVSAPHLKQRYDRLWRTDEASTRDVPAGRWHRTGDVGHLDADGQLWIEGRLPHVIVTADGPLSPVGTEQQVEAVNAVRRAAIVGIGPEGNRQCVAVIETVPGARHAGIAEPEVTRAVRAAASVPLVAVLVVTELPTDIRHNSKIDRVALSVWADGILSGQKMRTP